MFLYSWGFHMAFGKGKKPFKDFHKILQGAAGVKEVPFLKRSRGYGDQTPNNIVTLFLS